MNKIANTNELQTALRRILAYAQTERPSRVKLASELQSLSVRVAAGKTYIVYVDGKEAETIKAGSQNAAEKKARKKYPDAKNVSVEYTEV